MLAGDLNHCIDFPCTDVRHTGNVRPNLPARRDHIRVVMVSAAPPSNRVVGIANQAIRAETLAAFQGAGYEVSSAEDIRNLGVYMTTAVKCPKIGYGIKPETIANCSRYLEAELAMFPNIKSILLMGNAPIKAINEIAIRQNGSPAIPTGSAYKVKGHEYLLGNISLFPSYPESGQSFFAEGARSDVISVDIRNAIEIAGGPRTSSPQSGPLRERPRSPESRPREALGKSVE